jgi:hypothetical protein
MKHVFVSDETWAYFANRLLIRVSGQLFESLTVLLTVYLTFLLSPTRDVDEISEKTNVQENKRPTEEK